MTGSLSQTRGRPEPGRELDAIIAEWVMDTDPSDFLYCVERWAGECNPNGTRCHTVIGGSLTLERALAICKRENAKGTEYGTFAPLVDNVPHYSTGIAAAWEVVDDLAARHFYVCVEHVHKPREQWNAWVGDKNVYAFTAPHAICLAALAALSPADDGGAR